MIKTGKEDRLALECDFSRENPDEGEVFLVVNNHRYGGYRGEFSLPIYFTNVINQLECFDPYCPELYSLTSDDIMKSIDAVRMDTSVTECPIDGVVNGYFDDPSELHSRIIFYGGDYAFDNVTIVMISNGRNTRLLVRDEETRICSSIVTKDDELLKKMRVLCKLYKKSLQRFKR